MQGARKGSHNYSILQGESNAGDKICICLSILFEPPIDC